MRYRSASLALLALAVVVYGAALAEDEVFCVAGKCDDWPGYAVLLVGALAIGVGPANLAWLANPLALVAWVAIVAGRRWPALLLSAAALLVAASFMLAETVVTNEAGIANPVTGLGPGYWLWLASLAITGLAAATASRAAPSRAGGA